MQSTFIAAVFFVKLHAEHFKVSIIAVLSCLHFFNLASNQITDMFILFAASCLGKKLGARRTDTSSIF